MYYVPTVYYWLDENKNMYKNVKSELTEQFKNNKKIFYENLDRYKKSHLLEKTPEYNEYKSNLIRLILLDYAHYFPDNKGKDLLKSIVDKWNDNKMIKTKVKEMIYSRTISNIVKYEKIINNIEEIMMLINLQILENFYE